MNKAYILVGGYPDKNRMSNLHAGGQLTASTLLVEYAEEHNIKLYIVDTTRNSFETLSFKNKIFESKQRILKLLFFFKENNIEGVIIFSASGFSFYEKIIMALLVKIKKSKTLFFIRSGHFIELNEKNRIIKWINKSLLKIPTYLGVQGTKWIDFYKEMGIPEQDIKLIPNWIRIEKGMKKSTKDREKIVFLYAGWMVEKKGVLELFDVIESHKDLKDYTFRFAGGGTLLEELRDRKIKNSLDNVEILGWLDPIDMSLEYKDCDVFILPSHAEGFPNVILEALNNNLPIISTDVGGILDSVIHDYNGFIFKPKDKEALYKNIKILATSKEKREKFSNNSKSILRKNHDFYKNCKLIFDAFN